MMFQLRLTLKPSRDYTSSACRVVECRIISCKTISIYQNKMLQGDLNGSIELPHNLFLDNKQISLVNCNIRNWSDLYYAHDRMQHTCPSRSKLDHVVWTKQGDFSILASRLASPKRHYSSSLSIKELGTNVPLPILLGLFQHFLRILHLLALSHAILIHPFRPLHLLESNKGRKKEPITLHQQLQWPLLATIGGWLPAQHCLQSS